MEKHGRMSCIYFSAKNFNLVLRQDGFSYELFNYHQEQAISEATGLPALLNNDEMPEIKTSVQRTDAFFMDNSSNMKVISEVKSADYLNFYQGNGQPTLEVYSYQKIYTRHPAVLFHPGFLSGLCFQ